MEELRQKPLASQSKSIFVLMVGACANPCYEYEDEPTPVFKAVGYFSTLEKALDMQDVYVGEFGWHAKIIKEAFLDPTPQNKEVQYKVRADSKMTYTWLPLTESKTKVSEKHRMELPDWEYVPDRADIERYGTSMKYNRDDETIKELQAQIRDLKAKLSA